MTPILLSELGSALYALVWRCPNCRLEMSAPTFVEVRRRGSLGANRSDITVRLCDEHSPMLSKRRGPGG